MPARLPPLPNGALGKRTGTGGDGIWLCALGWHLSSAKK